MTLSSQLINFSYSLPKNTGYFVILALIYSMLLKFVNFLNLFKYYFALLLLRPGVHNRLSSSRSVV
jgi:hypothetical protein